jgi:hypothetical protein
MKSFFFLLLISCAFYPSFAQQSEIKFAHLTTAEGLSQSNVKNIIQDRHGFMPWLYVVWYKGWLE